MSDNDLFADAFKSELTEIHSWKVIDEEGKETFPTHAFGYVFNELKETKDGDDYFTGMAYYPDGRVQSEIIFPFKSLRTQLENLFGDLEEALDKKVLIKYGGKKKHPTMTGKMFHSCFVQIIG